MSRMKNKKFISCLLALVMALSVCPLSAFASTVTLTQGKVGPSPNGAVASIPCEWKKAVATGTVNGNMTSYNTIGRNSSNRYFEAKATNSKSVNKMAAKLKAVKNSTGETLYAPNEKVISNTNTVKITKWQYSGATYKITCYTTTESRANQTYSEQITHIY